MISLSERCTAKFLHGSPLPVERVLDNNLFSTCYHGKAIRFSKIQSVFHMLIICSVLSVNQGD